MEKWKLLSTLLQELSSYVPEEFQRKTFDLDNLSNWKATQYRFILLYAGPIIFQKVLSPIKYKHILNLNCASRILFDRKIAVKRVDEAEEMTKKFVSKMPEHYGKTSQVINNHNLIHSADDVRYMQAPLSVHQSKWCHKYTEDFPKWKRLEVKQSSDIV